MRLSGKPHPSTPILATALAAAIAAIVVLLVLLLTSGDSDRGSSGAFTLSGTFTLTDGVVENAGPGECAGTGGYDDIGEGTQVTVYSSAVRCSAPGHSARRRTCLPRASSRSPWTVCRAGTTSTRSR